MKKIQGCPDLERDEDSGAVININEKAWRQHIFRKRRDQNKDKQLKELRDELGDIKVILRQLMEQDK